MQNGSSQHPGEQYEAQVLDAKRRATEAMVALGLTLGQRVFSVAVAQWQTCLVHRLNTAAAPSQAVLELSDTLTQAGGIASLLLLVVTAVLFLRWLSLAVRLTRALGGETLLWVPSDAVWAFFIPVVSFVRPYRVVRDVYDHLAPDLVPPPQPVVSADDNSGYRELAMVPPPPPRRLSRASIGAWWTAWWVGNVLGNIAARTTNLDGLEGIVTRNEIMSASDAADVISVLLALLVVRAVTSRLLERFRRVRYSTPEQLTAADVRIL